MQEQFLPSNYLQTFKQYHHCQQGNRGATEYADEFQELRARNDLEKSGSQEVLRFVSSLKEPLRRKVDVRNVGSFSKALTLALKYEAQLQRYSRNRIPKR